MVRTAYHIMEHKDILPKLLYVQDWVVIVRSNFTLNVEFQELVGFRYRGGLNYDV